jgi:hypothetical protein
MVQLSPGALATASFTRSKARARRCNAECRTGNPSARPIAAYSDINEIDRPLVH